MPTRAFVFGSGRTDTASELRSGFANPTTVNNYMTFESPVGTDVQVAAGATLYISRLIFFNVSATSRFSLGYGDTGVPNQSTAPTNSVVVIGSIVVKTGLLEESLDISYQIPADKFPWVRMITNADGHFHFEGIEF